MLIRIRRLFIAAPLSRNSFLKSRRCTTIMAVTRKTCSIFLLQNCASAVLVSTDLYRTDVLSQISLHFFAFLKVDLRIIVYKVNLCFLRIQRLVVPVALSEQRALSSGVFVERVLVLAPLSAHRCVCVWGGRGNG